jgi:hypothetical protein
MKKMQESEASQGTASRETKCTVSDRANEMKKIEEEIKAEEDSTRS